MSNLKRDKAGKYMGLIVLTPAEAGTAEVLGYSVVTIRGNPHIREPNLKKAGKIAGDIGEARERHNKCWRMLKKSARRQF